MEDVSLQANKFSHQGFILEREGDLNGAEAMYQSALQLQPNMAEVHHRLGRVCKKQRKWEEAAEFMRRAVELDPSNEAWLSNLEYQENRNRWKIILGSLSCILKEKRFRDALAVLKSEYEQRMPTPEDIAAVIGLYSSHGASVLWSDDGPLNAIIKVKPNSRQAKLASDVTKALSIAFRKRYIALKKIRAWFDSQEASMSNEANLIFRCMLADWYTGYAPSQVEMSMAYANNSSDEMALALAAILPCFSQHEGESFAEKLAYSKHKDTEIFEALHRFYYLTGRHAHAVRLVSRHPELAKKVAVRAHLDKNPLHLRFIHAQCMQKIAKDQLYPDPKTVSQGLESKEKKVLLTFGNLCSNILEPLFWRVNEEIYLGSLAVIDSRLRETVQATLPNINIIPRIPNYLCLEVKGFSEVTDKKAFKLLDNHSLRLTRGCSLSLINYSKSAQSDSFNSYIETGWLSPMNSLYLEAVEFLASLHGPAIGFSLASSHQSDLRNSLQLSLQQLISLIKQRNQTPWVCLDSSLDKKTINYIETSSGSQIVVPPFDLYNDLDRLMATMKALDFLFLPPNSLMDIAASVGASAAIVTPRRMTQMLFNEDGRYCFGKSIINVALEDVGPSFSDIFNKVSKLLGVNI